MKINMGKIIFLWLIGVLAAAQLAKMSVLAPELRLDFDLSLLQVGLLISLLEVGGAVFGFAAGILIGRCGALRFLLTGLVVLMLAGATEAMVVSKYALIAARAIEGVGYALVVVAAPTIIAAITTKKQRGPALALWGTFVPLGVASGSVITGVLALTLKPAGVLLSWAALSGLALILATRLQGASSNAHSRLEMPPASAWLSTASFGLYTTLLCALTALLPMYLVGRQGTSLAAASAMAGFVSASALPGCLMIMLFLHRNFLSQSQMVSISAACLFVSAASAFAIFGCDARVSQVSEVVALALFTVLLGGFTPPLILARLPQYSGAESGNDPKLAVAQGLLTQFGAGGALIGPPLAGLVVGANGWGGLGELLAALTIASVLVLLVAEWLLRKQKQSTTG